MASTSPDPRTSHDLSDDTDLDLSRRVIEPDLVHEQRSGGDAEVGTQFDLNWRGYDRHQVDAYLRTWGEDYWATRNERDALLVEVDQLRAAPPTQLTPLSSMSARLQGIVSAAEEEAEALRHESRQQADDLLADARDQADADRAAAAAERSVAMGEAARVTSEARERHDRLVADAQERADRTTLDAQTEATRLVDEATAEAHRLISDATAEADEIRRIVAAEEEQVLSAARAEAEELTRSTARQRDIAEAEHQRLLTAHASQQRHFSEGLRREIAELQSEAERLTTEVERRRTQVLAAQTPPSTPPPTRTAVAKPAAPVAPPVTTTMLSSNDVAAAALDEIHALGEDSGEIAPLETFMHHGDTGEVYVAEETSIFDRFPQASSERAEPKSAIDALRRTDRDDSYADDALGLVSDDEPTGETPHA